MTTTTNLAELVLRLQVAEVTLSTIRVLSQEDVDKVASAREYVQSVIDSLSIMMDDSHG